MMRFFPVLSQLVARRVVTLGLWLWCVAAAAPLIAVQAQGPPSQTVRPPATVVESQDASDVRDQFVALLEKHPPSLGRVLKLDPTLLTNDAYLAPYPALVAFLTQHPEVRRTPGYFLEQINVGYGYYRTPAQDAWNGMMEALSVFVVMIVIISALAWMIRTLIDYRRWNRLSKTQAEVHAKLLDRFTANDELLAYVQSPAGSRFLQSAPIALDPGGRAPGAPFSRILWSVQAGVVLMAAGLGLCYVSHNVEGTAGDIVAPLYTIGVFGVALGIGFVVSAVVSFMLTKRLGFLDTPGAAPVDRRDATGV
jgi:hypothetical protein